MPNMQKFNTMLFFLLTTFSTISMSATCGDHPWNHSLPDSKNSHEFKVITDLSMPVVDEHIDEAKTMLKDLKSVEVSDVIASHLIGETFVNSTAYHLYLIRALKDSNSASVVIYRNRDLLYSESIGMEPAQKVVEAPMVIKLDVSPSDVFVSCTSTGAM